MKKYAEMSKDELMAELELVQEKYDALKAQKLSLNMARGKPGKEQLDMVSDITEVLKSDSDFMCDGIDARNYGNLEGLPSCRKLFADVLGVQPENVFIGGIRHHRQVLHPRPRQQRQALGQARRRQMALPRPRL